MKPEDAWLATQGQLQLQLHKATYETWVRDCQYVGFENGTFTLSVRNGYAKEWMEQRLYRAIRHTLSTILRESLEVAFIVETPKLKKSYFEDDAYLPLLGDQVTAPTLLPIESEPVSLFDDAHHDNTFLARQEPAWEANLNSTYTFDNFVVGSHNRMAHAAAEAITHHPGQSYNPLFVVSSTGLGKTHLLHAIGNVLLRQGRRVRYTTAEEFTNHLVTAIRHKTTEAFREYFRNVDVLVVDDVQFFAGKASSQEEFFHTFNTLHALGKQVILAADRLPYDIERIEEKLCSRLSSGLIVEMIAPAPETRVAIVIDKAETQGHFLPLHIAELIAGYAGSSIRELEGILNQVLAYTTLIGNRLTAEIVERILCERRGQRDQTSIKRRLGLGDVIEVIADYYQLSLDELTGKSRVKDVAQVRQLAIYLAREETDASLPEIGEALGGRNHSTVIYSYNKIAKEIEENPVLRDKIEMIRKHIRQRNSLFS